MHAGVVALVHPVLPDLLVQAHQRGALLREHQDAGCLAIETMHQFEELRVRTRLPHLFDHAERDTAAAVHRDARRLVDDEYRVVLEQHVEMRGRHDRRVGAREVRGGHAHRRHAHDVAVGEPVLRIDPTLIDADFPASQDPVNMAFRHAFADAQQEVVDTLTCSAVVDLDHRDLATCDRFLGYFA